MFQLSMSQVLISNYTGSLNRGFRYFMFSIMCLSVFGEEEFTEDSEILVYWKGGQISKQELYVYMNSSAYPLQDNGFYRKFDIPQKRYEAMQSRVIEKTLAIKALDDWLDQSLEFTAIFLPLKHRLISTKLLEEHVKSKVFVTQEEIESEYERKKQNFPDKPQVRLRRIYFPLEQESSRTDVYEKAQEAITRLKAGEEFQLLAQEFDTHSKEPGRNFKTRQELLPRKDLKLLKALPLGQHSNILASSDGFRIVQVEEWIPSQPKPLKQVQAALKYAIKQRRQNLLRNSIIIS